MKNEKTTKTKATTSRKSVADAIATQDKEVRKFSNTPEIQEAIRVKAYELFLERGGVHGYHDEDWKKAEDIILKKTR
jgi:hypothetical protein